MVLDFRMADCHRTDSYSEPAYCYTSDQQSVLQVHCIADSYPNQADQSWSAD